MAYWLSVVVAIASMLLGLLGDAMALGLLLAGGANASPAMVRMLKRLMLMLALATIGCLGGSIALLMAGHPWWASLVGALPFLVLNGLLFAVSLRQAFSR